MAPLLLYPFPVSPVLVLLLSRFSAPAPPFPAIVSASTELWERKAVNGRVCARSLHRVRETLKREKPLRRLCLAVEAVAVVELSGFSGFSDPNYPVMEPCTAVEAVMEQSGYTNPVRRWNSTGAEVVMVVEAVATAEAVMEQSGFSDPYP